MSNQEWSPDPDGAGSGPIRVFYMSYWSGYFRDCTSIDDAADFVADLHQEQDDDGWFQSKGSFERAVDTRAGQDVTAEVEKLSYRSEEQV